MYGLAALWGHQGARQKIYQLKRRPADKRLQMLAASVDVAVAAGLCPDDRLERLGRQFWPGALTVVAAARGGDSIGLRIPAHPFLAALLERLGELLALYREVLEACEAEKQQVGSELRQLRQASAGVQAYQDAE